MKGNRSFFLRIYIYYLATHTLVALFFSSNGMVHGPTGSHVPTAPWSPPDRHSTMISTSLIVSKPPT
jgi:hypothetical protein